MRNGRRLGGALIEIAAGIGEPLPWALVDRFGGQEIWVPAADGLEPGHPIAMALGLDAARAFCRRFEGPRFLVPTGRMPGRRSDLDAATVRALIAEGRPAAAVARLSDCHIRTVWRHRRVLRAG